MPPKAKDRSIPTVPVVEIRRPDPAVANRTYGYTGLAKGTKVLVTAGGAVADATVCQLMSAGCKVTVLGAAATVAPKYAVVDGSVKSSEACAKAVAGQDVVVHAGKPSSAAGTCGYLVEGTRNLLEAAAATGVKGFVFASSASVVFEGKDLKTVSEDTPYASHFVDPLSAATAEAEKIVLRANAYSTTHRNGSAGAGDARGMRTCSIRAASVYGPGESERLIPGLALRAKSGARPVGDGKNVVDFVYAGNVAHALLLAAQGLLSPPPPPTPLQAPGSGFVSSPTVAAAAPGAGVAGRAFFVTDEEPVPFGEFAGRALSRLGYPAPDGAGGAGGIPVALAAVLAFLFRILALVVSPVFAFRPALTAQRVAEESRIQRFDTSTARKELGYAPLWTQEEGLDLSLHEAESLRNPRAKVKHVGPFTAGEVARHSTEEDAWIIVDGKVYDVTPYLGQHPGGDAILRNAGGDSTEGMHGPQHPAQAMEILEQHYIGQLEA